ncbi:ADP-ribosyltransferase [Nocardia sp. NPDC051030]|uniref:ADP-ribosyltransferase n=1 Tax=Nocardia sp. NPDC051030 TaxID=3155162 RepID=UPI00343728C9
MCRSKDHGSGRRCPGCGSYAASAKANANRRLSREARAKVVRHLQEQGLVETAAALQAAPPSVLAEFMERTGVDVSVLGDTPMPSTHAHPPSAQDLVALAQSERAALSGTEAPDSAQALLTQAETHLAEATADADAARKGLTSARSTLRKVRKAYREGDVPEQDFLDAEKAVTDAAIAFEQAVARRRDAAAEYETARFMANQDLPESERDAYYATLSDEQVDAIAKSFTHAQAVDAADAADAMAGVTPITLGERDTSIYTPATLTLDTGKGTTDVEGRLLDGGTAIHRREAGDFVVLQKIGEAYHPVGHAGSKADALSKANRIPVLGGLEPPAADANEMATAAWKLKTELALKVARQAGDGTATTLDAQQQIITAGMSGAVEDLSNTFGGAVVRTDIFEGTRRHRHLLRLQAADEAGAAARTTALTGGASTAAAAAAYDEAYRRAMGTPTVGGGVIPHFDHDVTQAPASIGDDGYKASWRSGIRAYGKETATDYAVIAQRGGDRVAWGFADTASPPSYVDTSDIHALTAANKPFMKQLNATEKSALTTYTGSGYQAINAAFTGRDEQPSTWTKGQVAQLESAFEKFSASTPNIEPMTLVRGTKVPSAWTGTTEQYLDQVFTPGAKIQVGKVTSFSTEMSTAKAFAGHPPIIFVIRTRHGIPVKSISAHSGENEVIVPPGVDLRCVGVSTSGVKGYPTVYLVGEDLCAEADGGVVAQKTPVTAA